MGILTVEQIVTADGYAADESGGIDFFESVDFGDESRTDSEQLRWLETVDAILLGRRTYEMFAAFWPNADPAVDAVAGPIARLPKHVVTNTLSRAPWGDGEIAVLPGDGVAAARALRDQFASVVVWGSLTLADELLRAGAVDVLRLRVAPVLLGAGRSFTPHNLGERRLRLERAEAHPTGHVTAQYRFAPDSPAT